MALPQGGCKVADAARLEEAVLAALLSAKAGKSKRGHAAEGTALLKALARAVGTTDLAVARALDNHAALEVRKVRAARFFGLFRRTRPATGVGLRTARGTVEALEGASAAPLGAALKGRCAAALVVEEPAAGAFDFEAALKGREGPVPDLSPLSNAGAARTDVSSKAAGQEEAAARRALARLRRPAPGGGFELGERSRAPSAMAALEILLKDAPEAFARVLESEDFERWLREDCREAELADLVTATRLRAKAEGTLPRDSKRLFVRLLSYSPLREAVAFAVVPTFVGRLRSAGEGQAEEIVATLEGLGAEGVLESLVKALFEVDPDVRPRVLRAMGAVGSPHVLDPLVRLALHSQVREDREEAAAAVASIATRFPGGRSAEALRALGASEDGAVRALLERGSKPR